jgi:hypothetical protein
MVGYLLEPGRFDKRGTELAVNPSGAEARTQCDDRSPRLAA